MVISWLWGVVNFDFLSPPKGGRYEYKYKLTLIKNKKKTRVISTML